MVICSCTPWPLYICTQGPNKFANKTLTNLHTGSPSQLVQDPILMTECPVGTQCAVEEDCALVVGEEASELIVGTHFHSSPNILSADWGQDICSKFSVSWIQLKYLLRIVAQQYSAQNCHSAVYEPFSLSRVWILPRQCLEYAAQLLVLIWRFCHLFFFFSFTHLWS